MRTCFRALVAGQIPVRSELLNTLRPRRDGRHFVDDIYMWILFNENCCILIEFSLKYVRKGPIDNSPTLVQIMAWCRSGDKPLSEPMMISVPTHICVTRPQWVNVPKHCLDRGSQSFKATPPPANIPSSLATRLRPVCQKRTSTSHMVPHTWHNNEPTLSRNDSSLGCLNPVLVYRY